MNRTRYSSEKPWSPSICIRSTCLSKSSIGTGWRSKTSTLTGVQRQTNMNKNAGQGIKTPSYNNSNNNGNNTKKQQQTNNSRKQKSKTLTNRPISIYQNSVSNNRPQNEAPGNKPHKLSLSQEPRFEVRSLRLNFNTSKLVYWNNNTVVSLGLSRGDEHAFSSKLVTGYL